MTLKVNLFQETFGFEERELAATGSGMKVIGKKYPNGIVSVTLQNPDGYVEVLPFLGGIIWDANFRGHSLRMKNMFNQPVKAETIVDTYGCFAFHSGLLAAGCPAPNDDHPLHGEFPCSEAQAAWLEVSEKSISIISDVEYVKGFGNHYRALPEVRLRCDAPLFDIVMRVKNLSEYAPMPLQYMCHMNYAFVPGARFESNLADGAFQLRTSVPAHVKPTPEWEAINERILAGEFDQNSLEGAEAFDPEIVYFADGVDEMVEVAEIAMVAPEGTRYIARFNTAEFPVVTRWILYNPDQQVAAFALPGTSRPEGFNAACEAGTMIQLAPQEERVFTVTTGIEE